MTLIYMDGFDAHRSPRFDGLDVGGGAMQDTGAYWRGGTTTKFNFTEGYLGGRAFNVSAGAFRRAESSLGGATATRVGFWAKANPTGTAFDLVNLGPATEYQFRVILNTNRVASIVDRLGTVLGTVPSGINQTTWTHYEFYANAQGQVQFRINGVTVVTATGAASNRPLTVGLGSTALGGTQGHQYDHLYITDGPALEGTGVYGVAVVAGLDRLDGNEGLQGTLVINGERYLSEPQTVMISSTASYADDRNLVNIINLTFPYNPNTGGNWSTVGLNAIEQWGLCYWYNWGAADKIRVTVAHLAVLEYSPFGPIITYRPTAGVTTMYGNWTKSKPDLALSELVREIPRDATLEENQAKAIFAEGDGCILFGGPASPGGGNPPTLVTVGLTFAEEFREDYRDWVRIDGSGLSFDSFFVGGYGVFGEGNRKFQDNFVTVNYENVPTGRAYIQGLWDYATSGDTGRWSMPQIIEHKGGDYKHGHRRIKIRGHGKALSIKVTNNGDYPFVINGWTSLVSSNSSV